MKPELTEVYIKELFIYRLGKLYWRRNKGTVSKGSIAGSNHNSGYRRVKIDKFNYLLHRVIYLYHYGFMPEFIDHKDNNANNNLIENLRECTKKTNQQNRKINKNSATGIKGVFYEKTTGMWRATIENRANGKRDKAFNKAFENIKEAGSAIKKARLLAHGEFCRNE